jgi:tetratricopeptide (TPR) repeat protein
LKPEAEEKEDSLSGKEISFTGRLVSMPRSEAVVRITEAGGRYVGAPSASTAILVAGQALDHLTSEGAVTKNLMKFKELRERGSRIRLVEETEFLRMLDAREELADFSRLYTAAQVSRIAETPLSEVRCWLRRGLLLPVRRTNRLARFEYSDIMIARALSRLAAAGVPLARIRKSLLEISGWLPDGEKILGRLEAFERGLRIRLPDGGWAEPSGQRLLDFDPDRGDAASPFPTESLDGFWFSKAVEAEERGDLHVAAAGYGRALEESPEAETYFNLGNVLYELGRERDAAERYMQAIDKDPDFAEAWNNLGNSLVALGRLAEAVDSYERALALEPDYGDAHCNLAKILSRLGRNDEAAVHRAECLKAFPSERRLRLLRAGEEME